MFIQFTGNIQIEEYDLKLNLNLPKALVYCYGGKKEVLAKATF